MGCTHSKNLKSKNGGSGNLSGKNDKNDKMKPKEQSVVKHFATSTSNTSEEDAPTAIPSKPPPKEKSKKPQKSSPPPKKVHPPPPPPILNKPTLDNGPDSNMTITLKNCDIVVNGAQKVEQQPSTMVTTAAQPSKPCIAPIPSTYYPTNEHHDVVKKEKSPEKKKPQVDATPKRKKEPSRDKTVAIGPSFQPQITPEDLEYIKRSVQQRNERRAYMIANRKEQDDTLYEVESKMPERDYCGNRFESNTMNNPKVY